MSKNLFSNYRPIISVLPLFYKMLEKLIICQTIYLFRSLCSIISRPIWLATWQVNVHVHSFIHYGDLYSAPSRLLLRSAPDPCTAKKKSFETRVECVRESPGEQSLRQRKPIPHRGTNHRECTGLGCGCTSKRNKE